MKVLGMVHCTYMVGVTAALGVGMLSQASSAATERVVYAFQGGNDGASPQAALTYVGGTLYGVTTGGGAASLGTVFKVTSNGVENVLHSFRDSPNDGDYPSGNLLNIGGTLYGVTCRGGAETYGTVYRINKAGGEHIVYFFGQVGNGVDGFCPTGTLLREGQVLYGTTTQGGELNYGNLFTLDFASGVETVLYSFSGSGGDTPIGSLVSVAGALYGTNSNGGTEAGSSGTAFRVTTGGAETLLHGFGNGTDGAYPSSGFTKLDGELYGTTGQGGAFGEGTVFKISTSGVEKIVYSFGNGIYDGERPGTGLIVVGGEFYGTTFVGGRYGLGTVFKVTKAGQETVIYSFAGHSDGQVPLGGLVNAAGVLYGTTSQGGGSGCSPQQGCGTVFAVTP